MTSRRIIPVVFFLGVTCGVVGCGPSEPAPMGNNPEQLYLYHCAKCHARAGEPGGPGIGGSRGPDLKHIGSARDMNVEWLTDYIRNPKSRRPDAKLMPAFGDKLNDEQIRALAEWLAAKK